MKKAAASLSSLPEPAQQSLLSLGQRLRAHRISRGWTVAEMAERLLCSPTTWRALEGGKAGTSVGVLAHALWLLGQLDGLDALAPAPLVAAGRRVRRAAGQPVPGRISGDELDF
ncbi:helix-turn-helix domain-containing protein [Xylophilus rhododendri]|uniref:Helix-turn-helix domain-containing protein n=1 Tax=Xylophilus rhododendri TaxID=2697032 RepID=A0A857J613_9BURK|nr:helix-turn-helix transcriptional regulator [Xylophilus rhododendri]QHI98673.1 helix-turn-helix domain-containing protein [Xylophilus rhododendri]